MCRSTLERCSESEGVVDAEREKRGRNTTLKPKTQNANRERERLVAVECSQPTNVVFVVVVTRKVVEGLDEAHHREGVEQHESCRPLMWNRVMTLHICCCVWFLSDVNLSAWNTPAPSRVGGEVKFL